MFAVMADGPLDSIPLENLYSVIALLMLLVIDKANAIGTAYLRAGYLEEAYRTDIPELLREYVEVRLAGSISQMSGISSR